MSRLTAKVVAAVAISTLSSNPSVFRIQLELAANARSVDVCIFRIPRQGLPEEGDWIRVAFAIDRRYFLK